MKRVFILLLILFLMGNALFSKSIEIVSGEFLVSTTPNIDEVKAHCVFKNVSNQTIEVKLYINLVQVSEGLDVSFCWGPICYPPMSVNSPREPLDVIKLEPGESSGENEFYLTFSPNGYSGEAIVEAVLFVANNPEDSLHLTFRLSSVLGIVDLSFRQSFKCISVENILDLEQSGFKNGSIDIYSINGTLVQSVAFSSKLDLSFLPRGIYLISQRNKKRFVLLNKF
ncbi:MAG: hypothetical protein ACPLX7_02975 [Candidatus Kapaibacteriota bacterium]